MTAHIAHMAHPVRQPAGRAAPRDSMKHEKENRRR
jgi:hypothetical protein